MRWTPIADMIEAMFDQGASLKSVLLAVRTIEERDGERDASRFVTMPERTKEAERAARYRANRKQNQPLAKANDVAKTDAESVTKGRDASRRGVTGACSLSFLESEKDGIREVSKEESKEESKKETTAVVVEGHTRHASSRGTRLEPGSLPSSEDLSFAKTMGLSDERTNQVWAEFVDYWIGIPGARGTKLNWSATWRNRVRQITPNTGAGSGNGTSNHRTNRPAGPAQTHGDAILAGMGRHAARVAERQVAERRADGGVQADTDHPDASPAVSRTAPNDRGQYPLLTVVAGSNVRK